MRGKVRFSLYIVFALLVLIALSQAYFSLFVPFVRSAGIRPKPPTVEVAQRPEPVKPEQPVAEPPAEEAAQAIIFRAPTAPAQTDPAPAPAAPPEAEPQIAPPPTPQFQGLVIDGRGATSHPYAVHVASLHDQAQAVEEADKLFNKGYIAYVSSAVVPDQGLWYRVLLGRYKEVADALQAAARFKKENKVTYASVMKLPYAIEVARIDSLASASKEALSLKQKGYGPYFLQVDADSEEAQKFILLVGAFATKAQAESYAAKLKNEGISYSLIAP